jgi:hypothetical protein
MGSRSCAEAHGLASKDELPGPRNAPPNYGRKIKTSPCSIRKLTENPIQYMKALPLGLNLRQRLLSENAVKFYK